MRRQLAASVRELGGLRGNTRVLVFMEPLWGIPYNLYATYASLYMLELGCSPFQVGLVSSVALAANMLFSLPAGHLTDRLGRRKTTLIFDLLAWSVATLIWAMAGGIGAFLVAAVVNSLVRLVHVSWSCLLIEGSGQAQRVHIYAWVNVAGLLAGFVAPLAGLLVGRFGVVSSMRGLYLFAFVSMTTMFLVRNALTRELDIGRERMRAVRHWGLAGTASDYRRVARDILRNPLLLVAFGLTILLSVQNTLRGTFTSILLTRSLGLPAGVIALFPALSAAGMLAVYLLWLPALSRRDPMLPLALSLAALAASSLVLALAPPLSYVAVVASTILGSMGNAIALPFCDTLIANSVREEDRASSLSIVYTLVFGLSAPFGYLGGVLASVSDRLPLGLAAAMGAVSVALAVVAVRAGSARSRGGSGGA